ncbi:MAG: hypothetical protein ABH842_03490 [Candidatus Micrarchaeota archaeon]
MDFVLAYVFTIIIESITLYFLVRKQYGLGSILRNGILASSITLPFVWFVFPIIGFGWFETLVIAETFAIVIEGIFYRLVFENLSLKEAFLISFICNGITLVVGLVIS